MEILNCLIIFYDVNDLKIGGIIISLFKRKNKNLIDEIEIYSVAEGEVISITDVKDDVFSQKMLGDGYAIKPISGEVYSPVNGTITSVFPTKHAIGIKTDNDIEILIHIGIDTVELAGKPFTVNVNEGDKITSNTHLVSVDLEELEKNEKQKDIIVIITSDNYQKLEINNYGSVESKKNIGKIILN